MERTRSSWETTARFQPAKAPTSNPARGFLYRRLNYRLSRGRCTCRDALAASPRFFPIGLVAKGMGLGFRWLAGVRSRVRTAGRLTPSVFHLAPATYERSHHRFRRTFRCGGAARKERVADDRE